MNVTIVTLDGPAGVGKSSLAKALADAFALAFLDTGSMFRIVGCVLGEAGLSLPESQLEAQMRKLEFTLEGSGSAALLLCNGKAPGAGIRTEEAGLMASRYAALPVVREVLKEAQRKVGARFPLVAEGRDMGSVVFPQAFCKFFLDADPAVRAARRHKQFLEQGRKEDIKELERQIRQRDEADRGRAIAPLRPADDAIIVDTSHLNMAEVLEKLCAYLQEKGLTRVL